MLAPWKQSYDKSRQHIKEQRYDLADKDMPSQSYGFSSSHVQIWELDHKTGWAPKNWCFWTVVLEKTLETLLDSKEIKAVNPKGNQPWIFIGRTVAEAEAPIIWPPNAKSWLTEKDPDAGKDWRQEKGTTEDKILDGITDSKDMSLSSLWKMVKDRESWCVAVHSVTKNLTQLSNRTTTNLLEGRGTIPAVWAIAMCCVRLALGTFCTQAAVWRPGYSF